ncbi:hypothetical protein COCNU_contig69053988G000010 [Cocos nucifera]|nr:hypothetical protein [Cocos nucifera]
MIPNMNETDNVMKEALLERFFPSTMVFFTAAVPTTAKKSFSSEKAQGKSLNMRIHEE